MKKHTLVHIATWIGWSCLLLALLAAFLLWLTACWKPTFEFHVMGKYYETVPTSQPVPLEFPFGE